MAVLEVKMIELDYLNLAFLLPQPNIFTFPVGLAIGTLFGALMVNEIVYKRKIKGDRIKLYSRLYGKNHTIRQFFVSVASDAIHIANNTTLKEHLIKNGYNGDPNAIKLMEKIDSNDPILRSRYDTMLIDLAKNRERLSIDLGLAKILFKSPQLDGLIVTIENSEDAIDKFIEKLDIEIENGQFDVEVSPAFRSPLRINCLWQTRKERDLKILDTALQHAIDNLLTEIKGFL